MTASLTASVSTDISLTLVAEVHTAVVSSYTRKWLLRMVVFFSVNWLLPALLCGSVNALGVDKGHLIAAFGWLQSMHLQSSPLLLYKYPMEQTTHSAQPNSLVKMHITERLCTLLKQTVCAIFFKLL